MSEETNIGIASVPSCEDDPSLSDEERPDRKRKRASKGGNQPRKQSASPPADYPPSVIDVEDEDAALDSKTTLNWREQVKQVLGTQSDTLIEHIVKDLIPPMLRSWLKIDQHEQTNVRREKPVKNSEDESSLFIPNKHRIKDTVKPPNEHQDEPEMKELLDRVKKEDEAEKQRRAKNDIAVGKLGVKLDLQTLRRQMYNAAVDISLSIIMTRTSLMTRRQRRRNGVSDFVLDQDPLSHVIAREMFRDIDDEDAEDLGLANTEELMKEFVKHTKLDEEETKKKLDADGGKATKEYIKSVGNTWKKLFPLITIEVFDMEDERSSRKEGETILKKHYKKSKTESATGDVQAALDKVEEDTNLSEPMLTAIRRESERISKKTFRQEINQKRLKYSGGAKSQASRPGKNGQSSSKKQGKEKSATQNRSTKSSPKQSGSNQKGKGKGKGKGKSKGKKVRFESKKKSPHKKNSRSASQKDEGQGGSRGGGKRKGANRR